jgi:hypothetical protein
MTQLGHRNFVYVNGVRHMKVKLEIRQQESPRDAFYLLYAKKSEINSKHSFMLREICLFIWGDCVKHLSN